MSRVATVNLSERVHNDTFDTKRINFFESDGTTPLDLSDATPEIKIRQDTYNGRLVKTCTIGDGLAWNSQALGQLDWGDFLMSWPKAGDYYYDVQLTYATTSRVRTYIRGKITVIDDAT